jgi:predicted GIY-YIG superfamily endonuclease
MAVYLIHFEERYRHAGHYLGYSSNLEERIRAHRAGRGARLMEVVNEAGIPWWVVRVWRHGGYDLEQALKRWHNAPKLCPVCNPCVAGQMEELPSLVDAPGAEVLDVDAFGIWLERWALVGVGWSDEPMDCPLGRWLQQVYGGEWEVSAGAYRWREWEWMRWQEWRALPAWAVVFLDRLYRQFGNALVLGREAAEALQWSLADVASWQGRMSLAE